MDFRLRLFLGFILCLYLLHLLSGPGPPQSTLEKNKYKPPAPIADNSNYVYPINTLNASDYSQLIDIRNFTFKILNLPCNESYPFLIVLVHTAPMNFEKRKTIRETWGQSMENMKLLFMLGTVDDEELQNKLELENQMHKDFVQGTFVDVYRNVTYKHIMVFKYVIYHCPYAKYILKTDDDIFVNIVPFMEYLRYDLSPNGVSNFLLCDIVENASALRTYRSKWRVSFKEYPYRLYPNYCPGWALLYSKDLLFKLYMKAQERPYFWIDDVLITGILMHELNITHWNSQKYVFNKKLCLNDRFLNNYDNNTDIGRSFLFGAEMKEDQIRRLWDFAKKYVKDQTNQNL